MEKDLSQGREDEKKASYSSSEDQNKSGIKNKKKKYLSALLIIGFMVIVLIGVSVFYLISKEKNNPPIGNEDSTVVKKFTDYAEMNDFLDEVNFGIMNGYYGSDFVGGAQRFEGRVDLVETESSDSIGTWGSATRPAGVPIEFNNPMAAGDYSTTNIQVAGVDEGDFVKTDGKYIYTIAEKDVVIIEAIPAENAEEVSRIKLDITPSGIYLNDDKLLIYGQNRSYNIQEYQDIIPQGRFQISSYLKIYDISDRRNPIEKKSYELEGNLSSSRMIGEYVYFITTSQQYLYNEKFPVPIVIEDGEVLSSEKTAANCNCPDVYYFDVPYQSYNFTFVSSLNIKDENAELNSEVYLLDSNQNNLFVSENNVYITFNKVINEGELTMGIMIEIFKEYIFPELSEKDRERIEKIENADEDILSKMEKFGKIMMIVGRYENVLEDREEDLGKKFEEEYEKRVKEKFEDISKELEKTVIHKIEIKEGKLEYKTSGEVTGIVLNQFSMDENEGYFRIATTRSRDWSSLSGEGAQSYSNLYVLDADLNVVGKVEELAEGERIYAVRFMQNRAYMVTFKQTDPLFVIGLDDPTNPEVLGELKVPGFSSYLHPYDATTLIGLGKESDEKGRITGGIKLSLFDVSDVANPKEIDKFVLGDRNSNSIAINEHKAFLFSKDKNLLVLPVTMQEDMMVIQDQIQEGESIVDFKERILIMPPQPTRKYFNGAVVFNISKKGFELKGKIDHADENSNSYYGNNNVKRSLYIGDTLYTLSNQYLKANWLDTLQEAKSIKFN
ncbi:beta-propeller domain-containing protein [Candidatus Parcubacteria bacterium]|nr:beta-propeller domain-containing protein [Candidatus Parcubacteria bacterium]